MYAYFSNFLMLIWRHFFVRRFSFRLLKSAQKICLSLPTHTCLNFCKSSGNEEIIIKYKVASVRVAKSKRLEYSGKVARIEKAKDEQYCCHRWTGATEGSPQYFKYCRQHMSVQGCGKSNLWRVIRFFFLVCYVKRALRKLSTKIVELSILIFGLCLYVFFFVQ